MTNRLRELPSDVRHAANISRIFASIGLILALAAVLGKITGWY